MAGLNRCRALVIAPSPSWLHPEPLKYQRGAQNSWVLSAVVQGRKICYIPPIPHVLLSDFFFRREFWLSLFWVQSINKSICKSHLILSVIFQKQNKKKIKTVLMLGLNIQSQEKTTKYADVEMVLSGTRMKSR